MALIPYEGKVFIATPFYDQRAAAPYAVALMKTGLLLDRLGIPFEFYQAHDSYIERARNTLCDMFLASDCTEMFFIDSDEDWDGFGFVRLLMAPFEVIGGSYRMKNGWDQYTASLRYRDGHPIGMVWKEDNAYLEADFIPCGFMRIKRSALEKFKKHYPELEYKSGDRKLTRFFECSYIDDEFTGEDVTFCKRWIAMGEKIWVEPNVTITHYGMKGWEGNLDKALREGLKQQKEAA
jgi:hypothetical protein